MGGGGGTNYRNNNERGHKLSGDSLVDRKSDDFVLGEKFQGHKFSRC